MDFKKLYEKEKHVVIHGQSVKFRIVKYIVIFAIVATLYIWKGLNTTIAIFGFLLLASLLVHFIFRWKTNGWEKSWWLYKHDKKNTSTK